MLNGIHRNERRVIRDVLAETDHYKLCFNVHFHGVSSFLVILCSLAPALRRYLSSKCM